MKTIKSLVLTSLTAFSLLIMSQDASAQKLKFDSNTSYAKVSDGVVSYKCQMDGVASLAAAKELAAKIKSGEFINKAEVSNFNSGKADLVVTIADNQSLYYYKTALVKAGVTTIYVDGKELKTEEVMNTARHLEKNIK